MAVMDSTRRDALCARMIEAARAAFGEHLRGAILKGSALKGDFIEGYSDLDVHLFVDAAAMRGVDVPALDRALAFQKLFGSVEPRDYGVNSCQLFFVTWGRYPAGWVRPIPGAYEVIYGALPPGFTDLDPADYVRGAHDWLDASPRWIDTLLGRFVDKPDRTVADLIRLAGTILKPVPYCAAVILHGDPFRIWRLPLAEVLPLVAAEISPSGSLGAFFARVQEWPAIEGDPDQLRELFRLALTALQEAADWHASRTRS